MSDNPPSEVLGGLPHSRPHRRSDKRAARPPVAASAKPVPANPQPIAAAAKTVQAKPKPVAATPRSLPKRPKPTVGKPKPKRTPLASGPGSTKAPARKAARIAQPAQPKGTPARPTPKQPVASGGHDVLGTAVQAAAEIAEIGLSASARAIRRAVSRLPRP